MRVPGGNRGEFSAWDPVAAKTVWKVKEDVSGLERGRGDCGRRGVLRHHGRLVQGARRAQTGTLLWQFKAGSGIIAQPITYKGPDGKQYVAVLSGVGGWAGAVVAGG